MPIPGDRGGSAPLVANRTGIGSWETFTEYDAGGGNVAIRAANNSKYVGLIGSTNALIAGSATIGTTQAFAVEFVGGVAPLTPNGLRGTPGNALASLTWAPSAGATAYKVKRALNSGGAYAVIASNVTSQAYTDTGVTNGTTYYYAVSAFNPVGESTNSAPVTVAPGSLDRLGWVATAISSGLGDPPGNAIDGQISTRWSTGAPQTNGQWFQLDMAGINTVNKLVLDAASSSGDYPRGYQVRLSNDGVSWGSPVASGTGSSAVTTITFPAQSARFIRVTQTGSVSGLWWSIHEANVLGSSGVPPAAPTGLAATAGDAQVLLGWDPAPTALGYNVKYATATNGVYSLLATNLPALQFAASNLTNGTMYYFVVSAVNAAGESANSMLATARPVSPLPALLTCRVVGGQLQLSWPQDHTGWALQVQTNSVAAGLGTNWLTVADSNATNQVIVPLDPSLGSVFHRLVLP